MNRAEPQIAANKTFSDGVKSPDDETLLQDESAREQALKLSRQLTIPPAKVPGYTISRCLGVGAYGSVWLAVENNTGKQVAIKFYTHRGGLDWSLLSREVEKLAVLASSRNIVHLLEVGWESDPPYYLMEYLHNGSLESYLAEQKLSAAECVRIIKVILNALVEAHGSGILHCDLKPANVLMGSDSQPRLCDFGQSRLSDEQNPALGTLFYMAPEQADLQAIPDARWDVYALGALLYRMLTGRAPYQTEEHERQIRNQPDLASRLRVYQRIIKESPLPAEHRGLRGVDRALADIIDRCLATDPDKRYPNAQAVLDALHLRDQARARRPLFILGFIGPLLLLLAITPIVFNTLRDAVTISRDNLVQRALESDALSARILARTLERELKVRMHELEEIAARPELQELIQQWGDEPYDERGPLLDWLETSKTEIDQRHAHVETQRDSSWFLDDVKGKQLWRHPYNSYTVDRNWAHRDYFHGLEREFPAGHVPADVKPIQQPHISLAFRSKATKKYMVAISVPVWDAEHDDVIGVLASTTHLGHLLEEFSKRIQSENGAAQADQREVSGQGDVSRVIALIDSREGKILDHPWMSDANISKLSEGEIDLTFDKLVVSASVLNRLDAIQTAKGDPAVTVSVDDYQDPIGLSVDPKFAGRWLAAFAPIGTTHWAAVVQERESQALKPIEEMQYHFLRYGLSGLLVCIIPIGLMWYFVQRSSRDAAPQHTLAYPSEQASRGGRSR